jgi:NADH-quinone oxidoreductase subunit G
MATVHVDGKPYNMNSGQNLLHGCLSNGLNLPYFCWHPAMGSVGACRQCAVKQFKDENDTKGRLVMACLTPATEGALISISDPEAVLFRKSVIEGLMIPHPHDCPVCDEGGECHLQDMTYMTGHDYRRYRFEKRTFRNQNLGPLVNHEMNRCIQCYRCVRYYREYAGGRDLHAFALRNTVFFGREADGTLENEFSGNLAEVCPTGVFTDKTRRFHYTRKWDLQYGPSICVHCGAGCNISAAERYGSLRNIVNRYNHDVNGYFLCDRGRFGYEYVNSDARIREARLRGEPVTAEKALEALREMVEPGAAIGIGSPGASLESNFALRQLVGESRFYCGMDDAEYAAVRETISILRAGQARTPSLHEIEQCDAVLILGEDLTNTAPRYALSVRQAARQASFRLAAKLKIPLWMDQGVRDAAQDLKSPIFIATPAATRLDDLAAGRFHGVPDEVARLGFAVARALDSGAPEVPGLGEDAARLAGSIAEALRTAERPLVISGASLRSLAVVRAAGAVARALGGAGKPALVAYATTESNTLGLAMMDPKPLGEALSGGAETVIVLENDLYRRAPAERVDALLGGAKHVVALHYLPNATVERAELVLPAGTFAESDGTLVSSEGRAQRFFQAYVPKGGIRESWRWLGGGWAGLDDAVEAIATALPQFARIPEAAPPGTLRVAGEKFPREPHRFSGRTAMYANMTVHEPAPPEDPDSALSFSMEGASTQPPPALIPFFWSPGWNSIQSVNRFQDEIAGVLKGGVPGVRLIEPDGSASGADGAASIPSAFSPRAGEWLLVPLYHIFGSDPLSMASPATASLAPKPYVALNPEDAQGLGLAEGQEVTLSARRLPVRIVSELPRGTAGVPVGLAPAGLDGQGWISISR